MERKLLRVSEVAKILDVTEPRVYNMIRGGLLPVVKLGRHLRIEEAQLNDWIKGGGQSLQGGWRIKK
jgi:excisionase family DNA binding protein